MENKYICKICGLETDDKSKFPSTKHIRKSGVEVIGYKKMCNSCVYKKYEKNYKDRVAIKRRDLLETIKNIPCCDCGNTYPTCVMDFDHRGDKKFNIALSMTRSVKSVLNEIAKCDIVCSNCHRIRTHLKRSKNE